MKIYGVAESWTKLIMIPHKHLRNLVQHSLHSIEPVLIFENHIVLMIAGRFVLYNLNSGKVDSPWISGRNFVYTQHVYHESLVSPLL